MAIVVGTLCWLLGVLAFFPARRDLTIPEGSIVYSIGQVIDGQPLYRDFRQPPYATTPYAPGYYFVVAFLASLFPRDVEVTYRAGRAVSLLMTLWALLAVAQLARSMHSRLRPGLALLAAGSFVVLVPWSFACRPDTSAAALSLTGLLVYLRRPTRGSAMAAVPFFVLALGFKQTAVAAPLALALSLLARRGCSGLAVRVCLATLGLVTALIGVLNQVTHGLFLQNIWLANLAPLVWQQPFLFLVDLCFFSAPAIVWPMLAALTERPRAHAEQVLCVYLATAFAVAATASLKSGADMNYFIEPAFAAAVFVPRGIERLRRWGESRAGAYVIGIVAAAVLVGLSWRLSSNWKTLSRVTVEPEPIMNRLAHIQGPILFGDSGLTLRAPGPVLLLDKFNASYLCDAGRLNLDHLGRQLARQKIAAVVVETHPGLSDLIWGRTSWWPQSLRDAVRIHYAAAEEIANQILYLPKPEGEFAASEMPSPGR